jgi:polysaccharide export outer membrane protein
MSKMVLMNDDKISVAQNIPQPNQHLFQSGDVLHVKVLGVNEESFNLFNIETNANNIQATSANLYMNGFTIDKNGFIEIPTLGKILVKGLDLEETKKIIQSKADEFLVNSTVVVKHINFEVTLLGEVNRPGTFTVFKQNITIFEALGLAGDLTDYANRKKITIIRGNETIPVNLTKKNILHLQEYYLNPNDVVYVKPLSNVRLRSSNAQIYISAISTIALVANIVLGVFNSN